MHLGSPEKLIAKRISPEPRKTLKTAFSLLKRCWSKDFVSTGGILSFSLKAPVPVGRGIRGFRSGTMETIQKVEIDDVGNTFKYILLKLTITKGQVNTKENSTLLVRGYSECPFHGDIYDLVRDRIYSKLGKDVVWKLDCLGGGRIKHEPNQIHIYGYSQGYGKADHNVTSELIKAAYEGQNYQVTWSDEGY